jgi:hypothetical protein
LLPKTPVDIFEGTEERAVAGGEKDGDADALPRN